jgi:hypothetical protein
MGRKQRIITALSVFIVLTLHQIWIRYLFPGGSLVGELFLFPLIIVFSLVATFITYISLRSINSRKKASLVILSIILVTTTIQVLLHPSEENLFDELGEYWHIFREYPDGIEYEDLVSGSRHETVAAMVKYKDTLPDMILVIGVEMWGGPEIEILEEYYVELRDGTAHYDTGKLQLIDTGETTLLIMNPGSPESIECDLETRFENMLNPRVIAIIGCQCDGKVISWRAYDFVLETGAERIFTLLLNIFK